MQTEWIHLVLYTMYTIYYKYIIYYNGLALKERHVYYIA